MFRDVTLGQYYPSESFIHRMDPRIKLLLNIFYLVGIFFINTLMGFAAVALLLIVMVVVSGVPVKSIVRSLRGILVLIIFTVILNILFYGEAETVLWTWWKISISLEALIFAAKMMLRLTFLVMGASILTLTTTPVDLTHAIESLLRPLRVIRFPVHEMALIMSLALSLIPSLIEETDRIIRAQKARGANFDTGGLLKRAKAFIPILIPLLVSSFRRADELALAMNSRCYEGSTKRTRMRRFKLTWRDAVGSLVVLLLFAGAFYLRLMALGTLPQILPQWFYI